LTGPERRAAEQREELAPSHHSITSSAVCISRESTNKQLRAWAKRGWIRLERGGVSVFAPDKLTAITADGLEFDSS
jgi:hypothetical protein